MSLIDLSEIPNFQVRVNNALVNATTNMYAHCEIRSIFKIAESFYSVEATTLGEQFFIRFLVFDKNEYECSVYLEASAFRFLILTPMTQAVENAIKDYHSIGHGYPKG